VRQSDQPLIAEVLYRSERTTVSRMRTGGASGTVVQKALEGPDALARVSHEARILEHLAGLAGVPQLLSVGPGAVLLLRDDNGEPLALRQEEQAVNAGPMAAAELVDLARHLARILAGVHRRGVLHLDIAPANILRGCTDAMPQLIDFHLAALSSEARSGDCGGAGIAGTLAYIAPELTGRLGLAVDHRADLYALGATLYDLATGAPPFGHGDPLQLIRDHIAAVPISPAQCVPGLPPPLPDIILRLLEKERDRRYQSADGLADDLDRLHALLSRGAASAFALGVTDFPAQLAPPPRLIGREAEVDALRAAFVDAREGNCRALLVSGVAGAGKTALVAALRPMARAEGGWFVTSACEQYRQDGASDAWRHIVLGILSRLLAEPEAVLASARSRLQARLGPDAGCLVALLPEMAALVGDARPPPGIDTARRVAAVLAFIRTVASPTRPVIMALDDMQWASAATLQLLGGLLSGGSLPGLLIVGAYREQEPGEGDALSDALGRWQQAGVAPRRLSLGNLAPAALAELIGEMLRLPTARAVPLAEAIGAHTDGNPFDTVELLNGLRRDRTLVLGPEGWRWNLADIRRHVGGGDVYGLLGARIKALPAVSQDLLASLMCLGGEVPPALLAAASGMATDAVLKRLSPALEDGLLVLDESGPHADVLMLRFRHHRVQEAVHKGMAPPARTARHLALARRLAPLWQYAVQAAEQYLPAVTDGAAPNLDDSGEVQLATALFIAAAAGAESIFRYDAAERYYAAAIMLLQDHPAPDHAALARWRTGRLTALYYLGRHEAFDRLAGVLARTEGDLLVLAEACSLHVLSLGTRGRHTEAVPIGLAVLERLGIRRPATGLAEAVARGLAGLRAWVEDDAAIGEAARVTTADPLVRVTARLINRLLPTAQLLDPLTGAWLALESQRLWATHGACPTLVANLARSASSPIVFGEDYTTAYAMARHAIAVGVSLGYEAETAFARQNFATFAVHWFEPLENLLDMAAAARAGLMRAGEIQAACINDLSSLSARLDCAPTLEASVIEATQARDFATRNGHGHLVNIFTNQLGFLQILTGESDGADYMAEAPDGADAGKHLSLFGFHCTRAILAILFDNPAQLDLHTAGAMPLLCRVGGAYRCMVATVLRALCLARQGRRPDGAAGVLPDEFHERRGWVAARACDAPGNYLHLLHFIDAEAAWTKADFQAATLAFDRAIQCSIVQTRPWHFALIAERAGLFNLGHGLDYAGRAFLRDAQRRYAAWGAMAVMRRLRAAHGFLPVIEARRTLASDGQSVSISSDSIDMLAILRASQVLSSQTTIQALQAQLVETLATMTGATAVQLVVWDEATQSWCLAPEGNAPAEPVVRAAARGALPISAFHTVERTRLPLVVDDALLDDRFARDPYFAGMKRCSLLVLPVQSQGAARAMIMLKNRLSSGVFSRARLNLVTLVASQLAVSLDNAQLYASLERRVSERTEALALANRRLEVLSISDGLTGLANRRRFDEVLPREWLRALRGNSSVAVVMIDIDYFKRYNDHYGHVGGDRCLRAVAAALQANARQDVDTAARYGGEEFALILPGADLDAAGMVAARAVAAVLALREPHAASPFGCVTISVGVAAMVPTDDIAPDQLVALADVSLYSAKQQGRNRVALAPHGGGEEVLF
jgi:diguanylate cyclase (GGDEF)-like protein